MTHPKKTSVKMFFAFSCLVIFLVYLFISHRTFGKNPFYILSYHGVDSKSQSSVAVTPEIFEQELTYLKNKGYQVLPLKTIMDFCEEGKRLPSKLVAITFDDTLFSQYEQALPLLKKYGMQATFFIWTDVVGAAGRLSWENIQQLDNEGMTIGAHTLSHPDLATIFEKRTLEKEIRGSKDILKKKLMKEVDSFSYPYNSLPQKAVEVVKESGFRYARTSIPGTNTCLSDSHTLNSYIMSGSFDSFKQIFEK